MTEDIKASLDLTRRVSCVVDLLKLYEYDFAKSCSRCLKIAHSIWVSKPTKANENIVKRRLKKAEKIIKRAVKTSIVTAVGQITIQYQDSIQRSVNSDLSSVIDKESSIQCDQLVSIAELRQLYEMFDKS